MSVLTAFHACVLPLLDAMEDEGQLSRREALKSPRLSEFNALADPTYEAASRVAPEERYRTYAYHPEWEVPAHGVAWLNGVLVNEAECHSNRAALQLAILDQSTPGTVGLRVLPASQQHPLSVSGLLQARAMVAIERGSGPLPAGTPVRFFLLD